MDLDDSEEVWVVLAALNGFNSNCFKSNVVLWLSCDLCGKGSGIHSRPASLDFFADGFALFSIGAHELVVELEVHPHARGHAEEAAQAQIVFRGAAAFSLFHLSQVGGGNSTTPGDLRLRQTGLLKRFAKSFCEEVEQGDLRGLRFHDESLVVVGDTHVAYSAVFPAKHDAPLLVDADAPEAFEVSRE